MTTTAPRLSDLIPIEPGRISAAITSKAGRIVADQAAALERRGPDWADYLVIGERQPTYTVRISLHPRVWSGACEHWSACRIPMAHNAGPCSHIVAAAYTEAQALGTTIPDPHQPRPERIVHAPSLAAAPEPPTDPAARAAWRAQRDAEEDGFYG